MQLLPIKAFFNSEANCDSTEGWAPLIIISDLEFYPVHVYSFDFANLKIVPA